jgi:hypothetical protein
LTQFLGNLTVVRDPAHKVDPILEAQFSSEFLQIFKFGPTADDVKLDGILLQLQTPDHQIGTFVRDQSAVLEEAQVEAGLGYTRCFMRAIHAAIDRVDELLLPQPPIRRDSYVRSPPA